MKKLILMTISSLAIFSCAPVLHRDLMDRGTRDVSLNLLRENPVANKGKLFILGGLVVDAKLTEKGTQIEALYVPVDKYGYLQELKHLEGRFLAVYPRDRGFLEPLIYKKGRQITVAGEFLETRRAKLDEIEYTYPVFEIKQIYLWEEYRDYYYRPYYYYYPYPYGWYDPWWRPYPYWYGPYGPPPGRW